MHEWALSWQPHFIFVKGYNSSGFESSLNDQTWVAFIGP